MFTPLPFPISSFILIVCFTRLSCAPLGINSSCLSAPSYQHTWGCQERDSVNVRTVYLRHYPAITVLHPLFPPLFIVYSILHLWLFNVLLDSNYALGCQLEKRESIMLITGGGALRRGNKWTSRCLSLSLTYTQDLNALPSSFSRAVLCSLSHTHSRLHPHYKALSYGTHMTSLLLSNIRLLGMRFPPH